jgi:hypothetical protein
MKSKRKAPTRKNPVAKFAARLQRAKIFRDRSKYRRQEKHRNQEPFTMHIAPGV